MQKRAIMCPAAPNSQFRTWWSTYIPLTSVVQFSCSTESHLQAIAVKLEIEKTYEIIPLLSLLLYVLFLSAVCSPLLKKFEDLGNLLQRNTILVLFFNLCIFLTCIVISPLISLITGYISLQIIFFPFLLIAPLCICQFLHTSLSSSSTVTSCKTSS